MEENYFVKEEENQNPDGFLASPDDDELESLKQTYGEMIELLQKKTDELNVLIAQNKQLYKQTFDLYRLLQQTVKSYKKGGDLNKYN